MTTSYDELVEAWRREFHNLELQPLRPSFFKDLSSYVRRLRDAQRNLDAKSLKAVMIEDEIVRLERLLAQLLDRRLNKLWAQVELVQSTTLESSEKQAQQDLSRVLRDYEGMRRELLLGREPSIARRDPGGFRMIRFVRNVPSIIGVDLKAHGPFQKEDVARLPSENAESLIRQGAAVEIMANDRDNG